jgi:hypothetical protein
MEFKSKPGSFTPYLEYAQRDKPSSQTAPASPLSLLELLAQQPQPTLPLGVLQSLSGMDPVRYREALKTLRDADYISIAGPALDEMVTLTGKGAEVARLTRPA